MRFITRPLYYLGGAIVCYFTISPIMNKYSYIITNSDLLEQTKKMNCEWKNLNNQLDKLVDKYCKKN